MLRYLLLGLLLTLPCNAWASGGNKGKPIILTVHVETDASEGSQFTFPLPIPGSGERRVFKKSADISDQEVEWFYLFPAENGNGFGAAFKFNSVGTNRLEYVSSANQGRYLLTAVHPGVSSFARIDKVISDGIVVVWDGLTNEHVASLREYLQERTAAPGAGAAAAPTTLTESAVPAYAPSDASADASADAPPAAPKKKKRFNLFRK